MKIVIDLQACQTASRFRGMGRYSLALALAMAKNPRGHELWLALNGILPESLAGIHASFAGLIPSERIVTFSIPGPTAGSNPESGQRVGVAELIREVFLADLKPDFLHVSSLFEGWVDDAVGSLGRLPFPLPTAVTFYDLIPLAHPETYLYGPRMREWYQRKLGFLRQADLFLAISEYARREARESLGLAEEAVVNISAAVDPVFRRRQLTAAEEGLLRSRFGLTRPFVLYAGGFDPRKNVENLIVAFARLDPAFAASHCLLIVGELHRNHLEHLEKLAGQRGLMPDRLLFAGYVNDADLAALYQLCELFVLPSLAEGFGLPALEAMACGAPVIGANRTSIPEVIGCPEALFDPTRVEAIAAKMGEALGDPDFNHRLRRHALRQAGEFSWERSGQRALAAMEAAWERLRPVVGRRPVSGHRPALAFISPLPPAASGIADYSAELLPALSDYYEITLVAEEPEAVCLSLKSHYPVQGCAWFAEHAHRFDRILYQFGNSPFHKEMFALLARCPGTVVLHDFFLSSVLHWLEGVGHPTECFRRALFDSHGYRALVDLAGRGPEASIRDYPCNLQVFADAAGIVVHSEHAARLAAACYGEAVLDELVVLPQARKIPDLRDRSAARQRFGLGEDDFLLCSFGHLALVKLNHRLVEAWLASSLGARPECRLVFVGQNDDPAYIRLLSPLLAGRNNVSVTGFAAPEQFEDYLVAADAAVQLREGSRGETSRAVLDCLAHGLPLIVNAHGAMAEWSEEILLKLDDNFTTEALAGALERLYADVSLRRTLSRRAADYVASRHAPARVAKDLREVIEHFAASSRRAHYRALLPQLVAEPGLEPARAAESIAHNRRDGLPRQLLVDISLLVREDLRTGIERVTRAILLSLLHSPPAGFRVEPVYADAGRYRYARCFTQRALAVPPLFQTDPAVDYRQGDVFLGLELAIEPVLAHQECLAAMKNLGVAMFFVVYDLLPLLRPEFFPPFMGEVFPVWLAAVSERAHGLLCISRSVAAELKDWLGQHPIQGRPPEVGFFHLGADLEKSLPSGGLPPEAEAVLPQIKARPTLLMVGTIEPRKGHRQALAACEQLWAQGVEVNLAMVGKIGWMMEELAHALDRHPELNRRLFRFDGISDEYLARLYEDSAALLAASEGEGFGLPLIEAARNKLPILARDLPVFQEVAGEFATYFQGNDAEALAMAIRNWLAGHETGAHRRSDALPWLTWDESAAQLLVALFASRRK